MNHVRNWGRFQIHTGDCREIMRDLPAGSVRCCVTSPPYFGLRDYGHAGQIGLEATPDAFVNELVNVFREVHRVLADDGTLWLNLGDSYCTVPHGPKGANAADPKYANEGARVRHGDAANRRPLNGLKHKDLIGIPWRVAFALQTDGWYLRQDIIWHKPNAMPESVRDRCTKAHEYLFLLTKSDRYFFDAQAMKEAAIGGAAGNKTRKPAGARGLPNNDPTNPNDGVASGIPWSGSETRNRRSVWTVTTKPFKGAHFATFPPALIEPCILAGSAPGDTVIDPFGGAGTTAMVAVQHGRRAISCDINPEYIALQERRISGALWGVEIDMTDEEL